MEWFLWRLFDKVDVIFLGVEEVSFFCIYCGLELDFGDFNGVMEEMNGLGMFLFVNIFYCRSLVFVKISEYENKKDKDVK